MSDRAKYDLAVVILSFVVCGVAFWKTGSFHSLWVLAVGVYFLWDDDRGWP